MGLALAWNNYASRGVLAPVQSCSLSMKVSIIGEAENPNLPLGGLKPISVD